jgi:hypothetical protein
MPKTTQTTVHQTATGQYRATIPKLIGDSHDLDGAHVEFHPHAETKYRVDCEPTDSDHSKANVVKVDGSGDQYKFTPPKALGDLHDLAGKTLDWGSRHDATTYIVSIHGGKK